jgi:beta-lactam-binding protein with PASTA domain
MSVVLAEEVPRVPSVTGFSVTEATKRLEQRGYNLQLGGTLADTTVADGLILDQSPKADAAQAKGGTVTVRVSSGPGDVELPKLAGVGVEKAKTDLEKLGLKPVLRWVAMAETPTYVVLGQKPAAGQKVKPGTEVQLTACR